MREEALDIGYIKEIFRRRKYIFVGSIMVTLFLAILFIKITPPLYEAESKILIVLNIPTVVGPNLYMGREEQMVNNEIEMIRSKKFLKRVVEKIRKERKDMKILEAKNPVTALLKSIIVGKFGESDIITIKARANSPQDAAYLANVIAEEYVKYSTEFASSEVRLIREFLEKQIPVTEKKLKEAENALKNFKKKYGIVHLSEETKLLAKNLTELDNLYNENLVEYLTLKEKMDYLHRELSRYRKELAENFGEVLNPFFKSLREELVKLETELTMYKLQGLPEDHPKVVKLKQRIEETKQLMKGKIKEVVLPEDVRGDPLDYTLKLTEEIVDGEISLVEKEAKKEAIEKVKKQYEERMKKLPDLEVELAKLEREYTLTENMYRMLSEKYEEVKIQEAGKIGNVRIVDTAYPPTKPIRPKKKLTLVLALFGGFVIGMAGVSFVELIDTTIKIERDIEYLTDIPVVGSIPLIKGKRVKDEAISISERLITHFKPKSFVAETFRSLRTNVQYMFAGKKERVILVTSSIPREGKSTVVANLGIALAQAGKKTLIVDTDLRKPVICNIFEHEGCDKGITDVIINDASLKERIMKTKIENLYVLPAGEIPANPSELLESERMERIMEEVKKKFDFVLLDSPPILLVTDPLILARYANLMLIVVRSHYTRRETLEGSLSKLLSFEIAKGIILNGIPMERSGGYYSYYYYGRYGPYYTREEEK
ncbi:hypothetical protein DRQ20_03180 [bacterium]|nr:MAG: hypothetical protein DRQ20_03180 [bacterium]